MTDLTVLRGAKQALDEGLLTQQDYECVKVAFLKAQQIKAGLDAGFIRREDYDKAVDSYMHALDFQLMTAVPSLSAPQPRAAAPAFQQAYTAPAQPPPAPAAPPRPSTVVTGGPARLFGRNSSSGGNSGGGGTSGGGNSGGGNADWAGPVGGRLSAQTSDQSQDFQPSQSVDIPTDLPDYCKGATVGKKSMAGIGVDESCINLFMHMKTRKAYKWLIFKVDDSGRMVVPDMIGAPDSSYNEFMCMLPDNQPRYAVYDYEYRSPERGTFKKLVFLLWAPDGSGIKPKMMYASTKDFFKGFLEGIGAELQANDPSELSEEEIKERVVGSMTRK